MIETTTLTDGGQPAADIASLLNGFLAKATSRLDIAIYDFRLLEDTAASVLGALRDAISRGVSVRILVNSEHAKPIAVPPPPSPDVTLLSATGADVRPVEGIPDLMHHKYVVRDGSAVWTGSTNWTEDSWTREENVILIVDSTDLATAFSRDFEDLWSTQRVATSGHFTPEPIVDKHVTIRPLFCPGRADRLTHRIAGAIGRAERRVRVASPVITSAPILGTLAEIAAAKRVDIAGVYDGTQMAEVIEQWRTKPTSAWKIPCFESLIAQAPFGAKRSTPYGPGTVHDYMHAKICVSDDICFVGSYNLSHSGEMNAENVLEISDPALAERLAAFVDDVRSRYPSA